MRMMCRPKWSLIPMYGSHDVRHVDFRGLTMVNETLRFWGVTMRLVFIILKKIIFITSIYFCPIIF